MDGDDRLIRALREYGDHKYGCGENFEYEVVEVGEAEYMADVRIHIGNLRPGQALAVRGRDGTIKLRMSTNPPCTCGWSEIERGLLGE